MRGSADRVIGFGSSSRLAGAYGRTMLVDPLLTFFVIRYAVNIPTNRVIELGTRVEI